MTTITLGEDYIKVEGHSGYDIKGKDIVCAAISTLVEATYKYLIATGNQVFLNEDDGLYVIKRNEQYIINQAGKQIFNEFNRMANELAQQYSNYIQIQKLL